MVEALRQRPKQDQAVERLNLQELKPWRIKNIPKIAEQLGYDSADKTVRSTLRDFIKGVVDEVRRNRGIAEFFPILAGREIMKQLKMNGNGNGSLPR